MSQQAIVISGTGLWTPKEVITNEELVASFNEYVRRYNERHAADIEAGHTMPLELSGTDFIEKASGIRQRYVLEKDGILDPERLCPRIPERSDNQISVQAELALKSIEPALENAGVKAEEVDAVLVACSNMQRPYPAMAAEVQYYMGMGDGWGYDMNVACSSATFGIQAAVDALSMGHARRVVVVNPEICSAHLAWQDRDCHFIFGDVSTAMVLEHAETARSGEVLGTRLRTQFSSNIRNNFGFLNRCDDSGVGARDKLFRQEGRKVFRDVCPLVAEQMSSHIQDLALGPQDLDRLWLHQANLGMNELIAKKVLGRDASREEAPVILDDYANTSSAGSIIAFHKNSADLGSGSHGVICSFGAGYSIGSVVVRRAA